jgi:hypothetical protein
VNERLRVPRQEESCRNVSLATDSATSLQVWHGLLEILIQLNTLRTGIFSSIFITNH